MFIVLSSGSDTHYAIQKNRGFFPFSDQSCLVIIGFLLVPVDFSHFLDSVSKAVDSSLSASST